ncbi:Peptidyl-tRNA hydrolase protein 2, mitochondrial [Coemansia sp. RSA 2559]|nr:Peptidyl-tRNA hydrolase protein 2, mitochondrial [Coemansia sp. RSA 2559]KAJ2847688.1 Peptidyl-tRNA hydrolase protein 2, mitochondrial [Coemansia erecta]
MGNALQSAMSTKVPLWQAALVLGGTALVASRLLLRRGISSTSVFGGAAASKGTKKKDRRYDAVATLLSGGEELKMVLIIRTDLGMTKGKIAAQCAHAALGCYKRASKQEPAILRAWELMGQPKVTLKCASEEEMVELQTRAKEMGLVAQSICDAGRTQIAAGSRTVLGIGPGPASAIDKVSGKLKLY